MLNRSRWHRLQIGAMDILMSEARVTGVALSCNAFPRVIAEMAAGDGT